MTLNDNYSSEQSPSAKFCIKCAHFHFHGVMNDQQFFCGAHARRNVVTGKPMIVESIACYVARTTGSICGPDAALFELELPALVVDRIFNPAEFSVERHGLNKSGEQNGVCSGVAVTHDGINLGYCAAQVVTDNPAGADCSTTD